MQLESVVDAYLGEWLKNIPPSNADKAWYSAALKNTVILNGTNGPVNWISHEGSQLLWKASRLLLQRMNEQRRITLPTARRCLVESHFAHLPKARRTGFLSEHAVIADATKRVSEVQRASGFYTVPLCFAPSAKTTRFRVGPAVLLSKDEFDAKYQSAIEARTADKDSFDGLAAVEWPSYNERYDHFLVIEIQRHESELAWKAAREVAEYVLNLIRIKFGFQHMDDVRVGNGFVWETTQMKVFFDKDGVANFTRSSGPWASHLQDGWTTHFDEDVGGAAQLLASLAFWMASGDDPNSPVLERLRYSNSLIAEAYSEPNNRIRLVRLLAALEALAALPNEEKSKALAWRCALAGGWSDCGRALEINDDVYHAYKVRNAVVHGDPIEDDEVVSAFYRLEQNLPGIYLGFIQLHAKMQRRYKPTHKRHIRQAFDKHIDAFFWDIDADWQAEQRNA